MLIIYKGYHLYIDKLLPVSVYELAHCYRLNVYYSLLQTPRILEATEKRQDPASPIQEVAKEGTLSCKTDIADGKVCIIYRVHS